MRLGPDLVGTPDCLPQEQALDVVTEELANGGVRAVQTLLALHRSTARDYRHRERHTWLTFIKPILLSLSGPVMTAAAVPRASHMTSLCWLALRGQDFQVRLERSGPPKTRASPGISADLSLRTNLGAPATEGKPTNACHITRPSGCYCHDRAAQSPRHPISQAPMPQPRTGPGRIAGPHGQAKVQRSIAVPNLLPLQIGAESLSVRRFERCSVWGLGSRLIKVASVPWNPARWQMTPSPPRNG